eukprot:TRINITY_DN834_c0_g1_i2.p1 TRINITY_DN834_c0_g1~~TRINITY_DN834_c0_g1_i2.p1  ORF type:complete len:318 (-),score=31.15 TRINITY_DN834_c0_g1_i2:33-986(-)
MKQINVVLCLLCVSAILCEVFVVQQDSISKNALIQSFDTTTGDVVSTSNVSFTFPWPLVETTYDPQSRSFFIITYPGNDAVLFTLDFNLDLVNQFQTNQLAYFDLQYSPVQETFYGIAVASAYGRNFSQFTIGQDSIDHTPIYTLPYMWYVNASSFNRNSNTYFALVNNFPGKSNSTDDQKFFVFDMNNWETEYFDYSPAASGFKFQFISWSEYTQTLYGLAISLHTDESPLYVAGSRIVNGIPVFPPLFQVEIVDYKSIGPLVTTHKGQLIYFVKPNDAFKCWVMMSYDLNTNKNTMVQRYCQNSNIRFVAASFAF